MRKKKHLLLFSMSSLLLLLLSACSRTNISANSTGIWDRYIVYYFGKAIKFLALGGNVGIGIIIFTLIIRIILLPLMNYQTKNMRKTQEIQPQLKELQEKYSSKDPDTQRKLQEEMKRVQTENDVNMFAGCLPLLLQLPIMTALYQAIARIPELRSGTFLWMNLGQPDPTFILPILAAVFTFISTYLTSMGQIETNSTMKLMNYFMPVMIFFMAISLSSGIAIYWVVSNAFQVVQTLMINNPFKIKKERQEKERAEKARQRALEKAMSPKKKRNKKR